MVVVALAIGGAALGKVLAINTNNELPGASAADAGKTLTVHAQGPVVWRDNLHVPTHGPDDLGKLLAIGADGLAAWDTNDASISTRYLDSVPTGTSASAVPIRVPSNRVTSLTAWFALPPAAGTTINLRLYRYRRVGGVFAYTQLSDSVLLDTSFAWSVVHDLSFALRDIDIEPTDVLAISTVNTLSGNPNSMRALLITIGTGMVAVAPPAGARVPTSPLWPPV